MFLKHKSQNLKHHKTVNTVTSHNTLLCCLEPPHNVFKIKTNERALGDMVELEPNKKIKPKGRNLVRSQNILRFKKISYIKQIKY